MKSKDQILLEEAYKKVAPVMFRDKKGNGIKQGDKVTYSSEIYKIVGGKSSLGTGIARDEIQLEKDAENGEIR